MLESIKKRVAGRKKSGKSLAGSGERRNFALAFGKEVPGRPAGRPRAAPGAAPQDGAGRDGREKNPPENLAVSENLRNFAEPFTPQGAGASRKGIGH